MSVGILRAPDRRARADLLVDWLEFAAYYEEERHINPLELVEQLDIDTEGEDPDIEASDVYRDDLISQIGDEIDIRIRALAESYPFRLDRDTGFFWFEPLDAHAEAQCTYLFSLILSHSNESDILVKEAMPSDSELRAARDLFQACATVAAAGRVRGHAFSIGWPRQGATDLLTALQSAWAHFNDGELHTVPPPSIPKTAKDDGIDILAFPIEPDGGRTGYFVVGQVASGHNWIGKSAGPVARMFVREWFHIPPVARAAPMTFIPFRLPLDMNDTRRFFDDHEYIVHRTRLSSFAAAGLQLARDRTAFVDRSDDLAIVVDWVGRHRETVLSVAG